jgi:hypothetical protein
VTEHLKIPIILRLHLAIQGLHPRSEILKNGLEIAKRKRAANTLLKNLLIQSTGLAAQHRCVEGPFNLTDIMDLTEAMTPLGLQRISCIQTNALLVP